MLLWSSVYSALSEIAFFPYPWLIIFLISDFSLPKFLPAVSPNLKALEWLSCPWFPAYFVYFSFENILLVKGGYFVLGSFPLANCAYIPAHPRLLVSDLNRGPFSLWFGKEQDFFIWLFFLKEQGLCYVVCVCQSHLSPLLWNQ